MAWNLTAQFNETCSCNMLCPCWFAVKELMLMDRGWCAGTYLFRIQAGSAGGVDLAGCTLLLAAHFPGPTLFDGNGIARLYMDERSVNQAQRTALEEIFQGKKGGPMEVLAGLIATWLPTAVTEIAVRERDGTVTAEVSGFGTAESTKLLDEAGKEMALYNCGFAHLLRTEKQAIYLAPSSTRWSDPSLPAPFETRSGANAVCRWAA
ncbi:MAG: DUF1326 domain-containing protein [Acidobacteria bacterium]|nr:DUF1326 domain-containing protein [Acidobacteriota bacterium]